jgi:hypothetical protein
MARHHSARTMAYEEGEIEPFDMRYQNLGSRLGESGRQINHASTSRPTAVAMLYHRLPVSRRRLLPFS